MIVEIIADFRDLDIISSIPFDCDPARPAEEPMRGQRDEKNDNRTKRELTSDNTRCQCESPIYIDFSVSASTFNTPNELATASTSLSPPSPSSSSSSLIFPISPSPRSPPSSTAVLVLVLPLLSLATAATAAVGPGADAPFVISESTSPSRRSMRFCMSSGEEPAGAALRRGPGAAYEQPAASPRRMQFSQGMERLHLSLVVGTLVSAKKKPRKIGGWGWV